MSIAAVVVSYNRLQDLRACLGSLTRQTEPPDEIIVVDNASTDYSPAMVAGSFPQVSLVALDSNIGGAGGFSRGVEEAIVRGHGFAWLMDDDACPERDALQVLREAIGQLGGRFSFLSSHVVDSSGATIPSHLPPPLSSHSWSSLPQLAPVQAGSFVGLLVNLRVAKKTWLPLADFFIHHDDLEYSARLSTLETGYFVFRSRVRHPDKRGAGGPDWRTYYAIRNALWMTKSRDLGSQAVRAMMAKNAVRGTVGSWRSASRKGEYSRLALRAWRDGVLRRPTPHFPPASVHGGGGKQGSGEAH